NACPVVMFAVSPTPPPSPALFPYTTLFRSGFARPDGDLLAFAREQIGQSCAPGSTAHDRDFHWSVGRVRNRFSVPATRRLMFRRWAKMINATSATLAQNVYGEPGCKREIDTGTVSTATIELSDT